MIPDYFKRILAESVCEINGKRSLPCRKALSLAGEHGVDIAEIGKFCNENGIRIGQCQLGCFK